MRSKNIRWQWLSAVIISLFMISVGIPAFAGDLNPGAPPGPTMKTLNQIPPTWDQVLPASERFKLVMGGAAVLDKETGLVWEQSPDTGFQTWSDAQHACIYKTVGGRRGWRLPKVQELESLVDTSVSGSLALPSGHPFSNVEVQYDYWSATADANDSTIAWLASFYKGDYRGLGCLPPNGKSCSYFVWCVRGGQGPDAQ